MKDFFLRFFKIGSIALTAFFAIGSITAVLRPLVHSQATGSVPSGIVGPAGPAGSQGPAGVNAFGSPNARTLVSGTALQCTDTTKPCVFSITISSTASLSLTTGATNTAVCVEGITSGIGSSGGTIIGTHTNQNTGTLSITLALNQTIANSCYIHVPVNGWAAVRTTSGTVTISNVSDQSVG